MSAKILIETLKERSIFIHPEGGNLRCNGIKNLSNDEISQIKSNKIQILNVLYGIDDINIGDQAATGLGKGKIIDVYPRKNKVALNMGETHPATLHIWDVSPIITLPAIGFSALVPHNRQQWSGVFTNGVRAASIHRNSLTLKEKLKNGPMVLEAAEYLNCPWGSLSAWKFARLLSNYLNSHTIK